MIQAVTFLYPSWRSLNPLKGSLNHPKKVTLNHQRVVNTFKKKHTKTSSPLDFLIFPYTGPLTYLPVYLSRDPYKKWLRGFSRFNFLGSHFLVSSSYGKTWGLINEWYHLRWVVLTHCLHGFFYTFQVVKKCRISIPNRFLLSYLKWRNPHQTFYHQELQVPKMEVVNLI